MTVAADGGCWVPDDDDAYVWELWELKGDLTLPAASTQPSTYEVIVTQAAEDVPSGLPPCKWCDATGIYSDEDISRECPWCKGTGEGDPDQ